MWFVADIFTVYFDSESSFSVSLSLHPHDLTRIPIPPHASLIPVLQLPSVSSNCQLSCSLILNLYKTSSLDIRFTIHCPFRTARMKNEPQIDLVKQLITLSAKKDKKCGITKNKKIHFLLDIKFFLGKDVRNEGEYQRKQMTNDWNVTASWLDNTVPDTS